jgi:hypothetical protein
VDILPMGCQFSGNIVSRPFGRVSHLQRGFSISHERARGGQGKRE